MTEVVGVRFKSGGKVYFFDPAGVTVQTGEQVVVETSKGLELGECAQGNYEVPDERIIPPLRCVVRVANADDLRVAETNKAREAEAFEICRQKIAEHGLDMKLVDVEYSFEGNKILFFFTSDGRVDFRELVKDLASVFRTRIELRQIGVRDEAKMLGGLGICGRPYCCKQFLDDFQPVSTKMAKTQSMSLNPTKISGSCGRLMCCLRYEQEAYEDLVKQVPKNGAYVETPDGYGAVTQVNLLRKKVKVKLDGPTADQQAKNYDAEDVAVVPGGRPKPGETPPSVLQPRVRPEPEPEEEEELAGNSWLLEGTPVSEHRLNERMAEMVSAQGEQQAPKKRSGSRHRNRRKPSAGGEESKEPKPAQQLRQKTQGQQARGGQGQKQRPGGKPQAKPAAEGGQTRPQGQQPQTEGAAGDGAAKKNRRRRHSRPRPKTEGPANPAD